MAIGDLHANPDAFFEVFRGLGLTDRRNRWIGRNVDVVQLGDLCDRGTDSRTIYSLMMAWMEESRDHGATLEVLLGNHEALNVFGFYGDVRREEEASYAAGDLAEGRKRRARAFAPGGELYDWILGRPAIVRRGSLLFAHADLPPTLDNVPYEELNRSVRSSIARHAPRFYNGNAERRPPELFSPTSSILWCRAAATGGPEYRGALKRFLAINGATAYVCGHTPDPEGKAAVRFAGRYVCIDTAMGYEHWGHGRRTALVAEGGNVALAVLRGGKIRWEPLQLARDEPLRGLGTAWDR